LAALTLTPELFVYTLAMKKLAALALALLGAAHADSMPEGSSQALLTEVLARHTLMTRYEPCPPAARQTGVQVVCANYSEYNPLGFMERVDALLFSFALYPDTLPELSGLELRPRTDYWIYLPEYGRYERSFDFGGGSYRIIYVPYETLSSTITILYTPDDRRL
jgi:hypothetical protein